MFFFCHYHLWQGVCSRWCNLSVFAALEASCFASLVSDSCYGGGDQVVLDLLIRYVQLCTYDVHMWCKVCKVDATWFPVSNVSNLEIFRSLDSCQGAYFESLRKLRIGQSPQVNSVHVKCICWKMSSNNKWLANSWLHRSWRISWHSYLKGPMKDAKQGAGSAGKQIMAVHIQWHT